MMGSIEPGLAICVFDCAAIVCSGRHNDRRRIFPDAQLSLNFAAPAHATGVASLRKAYAHRVIVVQVPHSYVAARWPDLSETTLKLVPNCCVLDGLKLGHSTVY